MNIKILSLLLACLTMVACSAGDEANDSKAAVQNSPDKETVANNNAANQNQTDSIVGQQWQLVTLEGQAIEQQDNQEQAIYFELHADNNRITGFAGCNTFNGSYILEEGMRIRFSQMLTTLKACPDVEVDEQAVLDVFELTDNYTLQDGQLSLNVGRRAPLAVFEKP